MLWVASIVLFPVAVIFTRLIGPIEMQTLGSRFCLTRNAAGIWRLTGGSLESAVDFFDLAGAISFARAEARGAEADIEIWADGFYAFVHQTEGWPHRICAPARGKSFRYSDKSI